MAVFIWAYAEYCETIVALMVGAKVGAPGARTCSAGGCVVSSSTVFLGLSAADLEKTLFLQCKPSDSKTQHSLKPNGIELRQLN